MIAGRDSRSPGKELEDDERGNRAENSSPSEQHHHLHFLSHFLFPSLSLAGSLSLPTGKFLLQLSKLVLQQQKKERKTLRREKVPGFFSNDSPSIETGPDVARTGPMQGPNSGNQQQEEGREIAGEIALMCEGRSSSSRIGSVFSFVCSIEDRIVETSSSSTRGFLLAARRWTLRRGTRHCFEPN